MEANGLFAYVSGVEDPRADNASHKLTHMRLP